MARLADLGEWERELLLDMLKEIPGFGLKGSPWVAGQPLARRRVALVTTAGIHRAADAPYADGAAANDYRVIPGDVRADELVMSHLSSNFDRTGFQQDANVVFPIDRLRELVAEGVIGALADFHYAVMDTALALRLATQDLQAYYLEAVAAQPDSAGSGAAAARHFVTGNRQGAQVQRIVALLLSLGLAALAAPSSSAQSYSNRIHFLVPFPPGGANDIVARLVGPKLTEKLGQQVVVDDRPGASGGIALESAARASPADFNAFVQSEMSRWVKVIKDNNVRLD